MRLSKLAFKFMAKYLVGWDMVKTAEIDRRVFPAELEALSTEEAREWAKNKIPELQNAMKAHGKQDCVVTKDGKEVRLQSYEECKKFVREFIVENKFRNIETGKEYTDADLRGGGEAVTTALRNIDRGIVNLFEDWVDAPEEVKEYKAWNKDNGMVAEQAKSLANAIGRVNSFGSRYSSLMASSLSNKAGPRESDAKAREVVKELLIGGLSAKKLKKEIASFNFEDKWLIENLIPRLTKEDNLLREDISIEQMKGLTRIENIDQLKVLFADVLEEAKKFDSLRSGVTGLVNEILNGLYKIGYDKSVNKKNFEELKSNAREEIKSALSSYIMNTDELRINACLDKIMGSLAVKKLNRDNPETDVIESTDALEERQKKILEEAMAKPKNEEYRPVGIPIRLLSPEDLDLEIRKLNKKIVEEGGGSEYEKDRLEKLLEYRKTTTDSEIRARLSGIKLKETEEKIEEQNKNDPDLGAKKKYEKRNSENKKDLAEVKLVETQIALHSMKLNKLLDKSKKIPLSSEEKETLARARKFLATVLDAKNPAEDTVQKYGDILKRLSEVTEALK